MQLHDAHLKPDLKAPEKYMSKNRVGQVETCPSLSLAINLRAR